jgi:hypothetical protein
MQKRTEEEEEKEEARRRRRRTTRSGFAGGCTLTAESTKVFNRHLRLTRNEAEKNNSS